MTKLWSYEVGAKTKDCNNVAMLRTNVMTLQRAAETQHPDVVTLLHDVATLLHDVATFGVDFLSIFSPF